MAYFIGVHPSDAARGLLIERLTGLFGVPISTSTIGDVGRKLTQDIEAPFIKVKLSPEKVAGFCAIAILAPIAFLFVILDSLWLTLRVTPPDEEREFLDLLPLYPSRWGLALGVVWIVVPVGISFSQLLALMRKEHFWHLQPNTTVPALASLIAQLLALAIFVRIFQVRRWSLIVKARAEANSASNESEVEEDRELDGG
jgi:hypothetical protein